MNPCNAPVTDALRIRHAKPLSDFRLDLEFGDGFRTTAHLKHLVHQHPHFQPLANPAAFERLMVEAHGRSIVWQPNVLEIAADNLRQLAYLQHAQF